MGYLFKNYLFVFSDFLIFNINTQINKYIVIFMKYNCIYIFTHLESSGISNCILQASSHSELLPCFMFVTNQLYETSNDQLYETSNVVERGISYQSRPVWARLCRWSAGSVVSGLGEGCSADGCTTDPSITGTGTAAQTNQFMCEHHKSSTHLHLWHQRINVSFKTQISRIHPITCVNWSAQDPVNVTHHFSI